MVSWGRAGSAGISREVMMQGGCCMGFGGVRRGNSLDWGFALHCILVGKELLLLEEWGHGCLRD